MKAFSILVAGLLLLGGSYGFSATTTTDKTKALKAKPAVTGKARPQAKTPAKPKEARPQKFIGMAPPNILLYLRTKKQLALTDTQDKALGAIVENYQKDRTKINADLMAARKTLRDLLQKERIDFTAAREQTKKIAQLSLQQDDMMVDAAEKGFAVLTKIQQEKLTQLKPGQKTSTAPVLAPTPSAVPAQVPAPAQDPENDKQQKSK